jgi:hypothetical protein
MEVESALGHDTQVEEDIVLLSDYLSSWVVCCQLVAAVGQQEGKPDRVDSVRSLIVVYSDNFVAHVRVDCMRRSHWHMAAAGKVQNPLQARSTTF